MREPRVRQLVWLVIAISLLVLAMAAFARFRLQAVRLSIDELSSETAALGSENTQLRRQVTSALELRKGLRNSRDVCLLDAIQSGVSASAKVYLDTGNARALAVITGLSFEETRDIFVLVFSSTGARSIPLQVDSAGNAEILLEDLPAELEGFAITSDPGIVESTILSGNCTRNQ